MAIRTMSIPIKVLKVPDEYKEKDCLFAVTMQDEVLPVFNRAFELPESGGLPSEALDYVAKAPDKIMLVFNYPGVSGARFVVNSLPEDYEDYAYLVFSIKDGEGWCYGAFREDYLGDALKALREAKNRFLLKLS